MTDPNLPNLRAAQAAAILDALERWIARHPERRVVITRDEDGGFIVALERMCARTTVRGSEFVDTCAQIAQWAAMEET